MVDVLSPMTNVEKIPFYSDASGSKNLGFDCVFKQHWIAKMWEPGFIDQYEPSIEYLELYALIAGIITWQPAFKNQRIVVSCDNIAVVHMVNNNVSKCLKCMHLLRLLVLNCLIHNTRVFVKYINTKSNELADALSRGQMSRFWSLAPNMNKLPDVVHSDLWPLSALWNVVK